MNLLAARTGSAGDQQLGIDLRMGSDQPVHHFAGRIVVCFDDKHDAIIVMILGKQRPQVFGQP